MGGHSLTVKQMVETFANKEQGGVEGYYVPKVVTYADKPTTYLISKKSDKPRDFISMIQKQKKHIPGPIYDTCEKMGAKAHFYMSKGKQDSVFVEMAKREAVKPGVGKYDVQRK